MVGGGRINMGIMDIIDNAVHKIRTKREMQDVDDNMTQDRYLRTLRRERRMQMEEVEKIQLKKEIEEHKKARNARYMFGVKDKNDPFSAEDEQQHHLIQQHGMRRKVNVRPTNIGRYNMRVGGRVL